jgi:zinc-ribbon domain
MQTCTKCGAKIEPDWRFCMNCSAPVDPAPMPPPLPAPAVEAAKQASPQVTSVASFAGYPAPIDAPTAIGGQKFLVLRFVAKLLKVLAVIQAGGGLILGIVALASSSNAPTFGPGTGGLYALVGAGGFFVAVVAGLLLSLYSWAAADFILVALAVEENTRAIRLGVR